MTGLKDRIYTFLRWSERYTKTDMVYVGKSGFWLGLTQVIGTTSSLILAYLFANFIDQNTFGIYKYILSTAGFLGAFTLAGMNTSVVRAVAQGYDGTFKKSLPIQLRWSLPYFLLSLIIAGYYYIQGNVSYALAFGIVSIFGPISSIANTFNSFLHGKKDFQTSTTYSTISTVIYFAVTVTVVFTEPGAIWLVSSYFIINALTNAYFCLRTLRRNPPKNDTIREEDISYAKHQSILNIMGSMAQQVDSIVVYHLLGPVQLAILSFATLVPDRIKTLFNSLVAMALPKLSEQNGGMWDSIRRKTLQLMMFAISMLIFYLFIAPFLYRILFPEYTSSILYSQLYAISLILLPSYILVPTILANREKTGLYVLSIVLPITKIILSVILIFFYGILGAVLVKIIHDTLYVSSSLLFARKATKHKQLEI